MQIPVWIEPLPNQGFRATSSLPLAITAEGATEAEALSHLQTLMRERLNRGGRLVSLEAPDAQPSASSWRSLAGDLKDEPLFDAYQEAIKEYRRQCEEAD